MVNKDVLACCEQYEVIKIYVKSERKSTLRVYVVLLNIYA